MIVVAVVVVTDVYMEVKKTRADLSMAVPVAGRMETESSRADSSNQ